MKKKLVLLFLLLLIVYVSFASFGWRAFGFTFCDEPDTYIVSYTEVVDNEMEITFTTISSVMDFKGAVFDYSDGILYIGARWGYSLFGRSDGSGTITVTIDENIQKIILKGSGNERELEILE